MRINQDSALGAFFVAIGAIALFMARDYQFGTANRMGPGYFPTIISALLVLTGIAILMRGRFSGADIIGDVGWKPLVIVAGSIFMFGLLVQNLGLPLAVMMLATATATASVRFRLDWKATAGAAAFSACCSILFIDLLGLPIPLAGTWLQALVN